MTSDSSKQAATSKQAAAAAQQPTQLTPPTKTRSPVAFVRWCLRQLFAWSVFQVICILWALYEWVYSYVRLFTRGIPSLLYYHHRAPELIRNDFASFKKIPQHIAVVLSDSRERSLDFLLDQVGDLACWSTSVGILQLTIYERKGRLKAAPAAVARVIAEYMKVYFGADIPQFEVVTPNSTISAPVPINNQKRTPHSFKFRVALISEEDGRESIVDLTQSLCNLALSGDIDSGSITVDFLDREIENLTIPEPQLLILFTKECKLYGFPPWQVRLTEIMYERYSETPNYRSFLRALKKYSQAEQRVGR